ncbi:hypothetical protein MMPV_002754 [Pyropia vietnamensis]
MEPGGAGKRALREGAPRRGCPRCATVATSAAATHAPRRQRVGGVAAAAIAAALLAVAAAVTPLPACAQGLNNAPHARWTDVTASSGLFMRESTKWGGALISDLDGDGWYDLVLNNHDQTNLMLFWNNRRGRFVRGRDPLPPVFSRGPDPLAFLIDAHGLTAGDIFLKGSSDFVVMQGGANGNAPATPRLLRSSGRARQLTQAQRATGLEADTGGRGRTPLLVDLDRDGDLDLILLNYVVPPGVPGPRQRVYENVGGRYVRRMNTGLENANVERAILTDFNGDGRMDVVAFPFLRLYQATGNFKFADVTRQWLARVPNRGVVGRNVWAAAELDANGDGRWDLYLAKNQARDALLLNVNNQYFTLKPLTGFAAASRGHVDVTVGDFNNDGAVDVFLSYAATPRNGRARAREDVLLTNGPGTNFTLTVSHGANQVSDAAGDSVQAFDYNRDGRLDLLIGAGDEVLGRGPLGRWALFANTIRPASAGGGHWLLLSIGRSPNRRAAPTNAVIRVTAAFPDGSRPRTFLRRVGGAGGSSTTDDLRVVHVGLGPRRRVTLVTVRWSNGSVVTRRNVPVDRLYTVTAV